MNYYKFFYCINIWKKWVPKIKNDKKKPLSPAKEYCESNNERVQKQAKNKYRKLSNEEKHKKENMEEVNIKICQNKTKAERIPKKLFQSKNINTKKFFFSLCCIKMKQKALMVGKQYISNMHSIKIKDQSVMIM